MGTRGRKSAAALAVIEEGFAAPTQSLAKMPEPPSYLTPEQHQVWSEVMGSRAGDLIQPQSFNLLIEYCRAVDMGNKISAQLDAFDPQWVADEDGLKRWDKLHQMAARNQGVISTLATKLRLATTASVRLENASTVLQKGAKLRPWEVNHDD